MKIHFAPLLFVLLIVAACGTSEKKNSATFIRDSVNVLTARQQEDLSNQIINLEDSTGSQIGIIIINTLRDEKIEDYSLRKASEVGLGRKEFNDGILITVAIEDKQMRIEVGTGLENIIKDEIAARIIREEMVPEFREAKYYEGLSKAVQRIKTLIINNKDRIGEKPQSESITSETPTLDNYLTEVSADTGVQELSGSVVLIVQPDEEQIDAMLKEYGEEDLSTILDDASFYQSNVAGMLDSLGIKNVTPEKRFIRYRNVIREWKLDLHKQNTPWVVIFFEPEQKPEVVSTIEVTKEKVREYFNLK